MYLLYSRRTTVWCVIQRMALTTSTRASIMSQVKCHPSHPFAPLLMFPASESCFCLLLIPTQHHRTCSIVDSSMAVTLMLFSRGCPCQEYCRHWNGLLVVCASRTTNGTIVADVPLTHPVWGLKLRPPASGSRSFCQLSCRCRLIEGCHVRGSTLMEQQ